jgi:hypothetical protein
MFILNHQYQQHNKLKMCEMGINFNSKGSDKKSDIVC